MHESIDGYRVFFHGIVGFFVCEDHILNTGNGLITRGHLDEVWSNASGRIFSTLQTHSAYCTDAGFMLKIKNLMLLFSNTLQGYGFAVEKLYALLHVRNIIISKSRLFVPFFDTFICKKIIIHGHFFADRGIDQYGVH